MLGQYVITTETSLPTLTTNPRYYGAIDPGVILLILVFIFIHSITPEATTPNEISFGVVAFFFTTTVYWKFLQWKK